MLRTAAKDLADWVEYRLPYRGFIRNHLTRYWAPKNFNFWYYFGSLALLILVIQIVSGILLTMNYKPDAAKAFASVEYIMRDVNFGWLIRYVHSTGASMFFVVIYLHMLRAMLYGSYRNPRELLWIIGMIIYVLLMAEAFMGYLLPWGQTSYWGAQVIVNLFATLPVVGEDVSVFIRGDYAISDVTLNRFFALHVVALPLLLLGLVFLHLAALHTHGSNNPDGVEIKLHKDESGKPKDGIAFHPYYTVKDSFGVVVFLAIFCPIVFFAPELNGYFIEFANFVPADDLKTPEHIAPLWYFTPFYSILRAVPPFFNTQVWGVLAMGASIGVFFLLPWLDRSPVKSIRYKGVYTKIALVLFGISFIVLGVLGTLPPTDLRQILAQVFSVVYFAFFLLMPWYSKMEKCKQPPERVT
ncbi:MAG: cytochrome bc complex cytochrome b subunit [Ectothiorhodospiraceae bacterium AqS1]|nr:cytochrome bc complex cytochrome b subunit [Ectothiorhodospiraceae bacterium AqS1]